MKNESPPSEGSRGGLFRVDDPPLKAKAFFPLPRGDFQSSHPCRGMTTDEDLIPPFLKREAASVCGGCLPLVRALYLTKRDIPQRLHGGASPLKEGFSRE